MTWPHEPYTEHAKLAKISDKSQVVGDFLHWLPTIGIELCEWSPDHDSRLYTTHRSVTSLLAEYFKIDEAKLEMEKRAMLDRQRLINEGLVEP